MLVPLALSFLVNDKQVAHELAARATAHPSAEVVAAEG
jgi:hypothetical protein